MARSAACTGRWSIARRRAPRRLRSRLPDGEAACAEDRRGCAARGPRALLRPGGRAARPQLLPRERPGLPADPDRHHRACHRLRRRPGRHVPAAAQGSRQRRLGASEHLRRRRVRHGERDQGRVRGRCQPLARGAAAHDGRRRAPERSISTSTASAPTPPRWIRRCATRWSSPARSRRPTGSSHPSRRGRSVCAMSMPTWIRSCATTPPLSACRSSRA